MHDTLRALGDEKGYGNYEDEVGNTYLYDKDCDMDDPYYLIGSHLDSVIEGGRYDGVAGVITGLMILNWAKRDHLDCPSGWAPCAVRNPATLAGAPSAAA